MRRYQNKEEIKPVPKRIVDYRQTQFHVFGETINATRVYEILIEEAQVAATYIPSTTVST